MVHNPDLVSAAVEQLVGSPRPFELATAREEAGAATAGGAGTRLIEEALHFYESVGAARHAARASALLRERGVRRGQRGRRGRPAMGWDSLTETELKVIGLIAQGLSNREVGERLFISRRTVDTHVSHALAKLGATSRVELVAEYSRRTAQG